MATELYFSALQKELRAAENGVQGAPGGQINFGSMPEFALDKGVHLRNSSRKNHLTLEQIVVENFSCFLVSQLFPEFLS